MKKPNLDDLIPVMPSEVLQEYICSGNAVVGIPPLTKRWLETSSDYRVEAWVSYLREYTLVAARAAERRELKRMAHAREFYANGNRNFRMKASLDPVFKAYQRKAFENPEAIRDTQNKQPKLFIR